MFSGPSEADEFQLEMSGLLGEMNCPYTTLTSGDVTKRLLNQKNCLLLLSKLKKIFSGNKVNKILASGVF